MNGVCIPTPGDATTVVANGSTSSNYSGPCEGKKEDRKRDRRKREKKSSNRRHDMNDSSRSRNRD